MSGKTSRIKIVSAGCPRDCVARPCSLKLHVQNGTVIKIAPDENEGLQHKACVKGLMSHKIIHHPDRLKYPLKRIGERGEGRFKRISWNEALDVVAYEMKRIKATYGPAPFIFLGGTGNLSSLYNTNPHRGGRARGQTTALSRLFSMFGGVTLHWGTRSAEARLFANQYMLGPSELYSNDIEDLNNSRLIILWGMNFFSMHRMHAAGVYKILKDINKLGCKIICVDPRQTDTMLTLADQWIPIRPGTDTAMLVAMAYVMIEKGLQDQTYLDKYTYGFDRFKEYVVGSEDGIPKTPKWAEKITGVPAEITAELATTYAITKPVALLPSIGPGRTAFGEEYHRAVITLQAMTGNIGVPGGGGGGVDSSPPFRIGMLPEFKNLEGALIKRDQWADAILLGKAGGYPSDIKMIYVAGGNPLNQDTNVNKRIKALKKVEFVAVHELFLTPTAKFADILLPVNTSFERNDIICGDHGGRNIMYSHKAISPLYESKTDLEICSELAKRLGIKDYNPKTEEEWLRSFIGESESLDYEELKRIHCSYRLEVPKPRVAFRKQIEDPENYPFNTPSGKIEIFSETLAKMDFKQSKYGEYIPPIAKYIETWESINDPLAKKYPLQLITPHFKYRINSTFCNIPELRKLYQHEVWININDAKSRGVRTGDRVKVFNGRGAVLVKANVTERIMTGVVCIYQGAWYDPDENGVDRRSCANVLTKDSPSPAGACAYNTSLVEVARP